MIRKLWVWKLQINLTLMILCNFPILYWKSPQGKNHYYCYSAKMQTDRIKGTQINQKKIQLCKLMYVVYAVCQCIQLPTRQLHAVTLVTTKETGVIKLKQKSTKQVLNWQYGNKTLQTIKKNKIRINLTIQMHLHMSEQ